MSFSNSQIRSYDRFDTGMLAYRRHESIVLTVWENPESNISRNINFHNE